MALTREECKEMGGEVVQSLDGHFCRIPDEDISDSHLTSQKGVFEALYETLAQNTQYEQLSTRRIRNLFIDYHASDSQPPDISFTYVGKDSKPIECKIVMEPTE